MKIARLVYKDQVPSIEVEKNVLGDKGTIDIIIFDDAAGDTEKLISDLLPYDGILTDYVPLSREILSRLPNCKVISVAATGWTAVDTEAASDYGKYVCAIGEYCTQEVADHTMALLLALERRVVFFNDLVHRRKKWDWQAAPDMERIEGQTLGILGLGKIGQAVARRARAFGIKVIAYDPYLPPEVAAKLEVPLKSLDEVLAESNFISIHMAVDQSNSGLLSYAKFKMMAKKPFIINVARGAALEEADLIRALDEGLVKGAALDVLNSESADMTGNPLADNDKVILTPHIAFYSKTSLYLNNKISMDNIIFVLEGELDQTNKIVSSPR